MATKKKAEKEVKKEVAKKEPMNLYGDPSMLADLVLKGDLRTFTPEQKAKYYTNLCQSMGLNPLTKPFDLIVLNGKEVLYANRACAEQLRKINGVSIVDMTHTMNGDVYTVSVKAQDKTGRYDMASGSVNVKGAGGEVLANLTMKAETKAKRRVTLSICGLGMLDETEVQSIPQPNYPRYTAPEAPQSTEGRLTIDEAVEHIGKCLTMQTLISSVMELKKSRWTEDEKKRLNDEYTRMSAILAAEGEK